MNRLAFPILTLALLMACTEVSPGHEDSTDTNADSETASETNSGVNRDTETDTPIDSDVNLDTTPADECDSTADCQLLYGHQATDCVNSQSDESWCDCGGIPCRAGIDTVTNSDTMDDTDADTDADTDTDGVADGVYLEVESIPPVSSWTLETSVPDYYGNGYFAWGDPAGGQHGITGAPSSEADGLHYPFSVGTSGTYLAEVRGRRDHEGWCTGAADDACNDVWARLDDGQWAKKMIKEGTWGAWIWDGKYEPENSVIVTEYQLSAGAHTYSLAGRSNGVKIDAIRIYLKGTTPPGP